MLLKAAGKRVSGGLENKRIGVEMCLGLRVRLHVAPTWFESPFGLLVYVLLDE